MSGIHSRLFDLERGASANHAALSSWRANTACCRAGCFPRFFLAGVGRTQRPGKKRQRPTARPIRTNGPDRRDPSVRDAIARRGGRNLQAGLAETVEDALDQFGFDEPRSYVLTERFPQARLKRESIGKG